MAFRTDNLVPVSMAVLLHLVLLSAMLVAVDFARPMPITPLAVQATLVQDIPETASRPVEQPEPEPEPEPEPKPEVETPPEPDNSEELRRQAEAEKLRQEALLEQERLEKLRLQEEEEKKREEEERKQREEEERKQRERDEAERKRQEEERKERERQEAERQRLEDIERQRAENERLRREMEAEQLADEIADEERRRQAADSPAMAAYQFAIAQRIRRYWSVPASASKDTVCVANVRQVAGGEIVGVEIISCNGDDAVKRSVEAAIRRASPLPEPSDPDLFRRDLQLTLRPEL